MITEVTRRQFAGLLCSAVIAANVGCGSDSRALDLPDRHPVQGQVTYRGQPAAGFRVTFHPLGDIGALKFAPSAITAADGVYRLRSYQPDDGAPLGEYAVTFEWPDHIIHADDIDPVPEVDQLRGAYSRPENSQFKVTVHAGDNVVPPFVLQ